jgi:hypothetical protein
MAYEVPSLTLRLKNPEAEDEWSENFKLQVKKHDLFTTYMFTLMVVSITIRSIHVKPRVYYYAAIEAVHLFLLYTIQIVGGGRIFSKYRTAIIAAVRTVRLVSLMYLMLTPGQEELAFPLFTATQFSWSSSVVLRLFIKTALPIMQSFGFRAPLYHHLWLTLSTITIMVYFQYPRCQVECNPGSGPNAFYSGLYSSCLKHLSTLQRLVPGPVRVNVLESLSCIDMCFVTNSFILSFIGFLVPSLVLAAVEEPSRAFVLMRYGGTPFYHSTKMLLFYTFALLPVVAALNFEFIATIVALLQ